jgi:hypothetical protein
LSITKIIILPVLKGYETWTSHPRENHRLRVFEDSAKQEGGGGWRNICNKEFHYLYSSSNIMK